MINDYIRIFDQNFIDRTYKNHDQDITNKYTMEVGGGNYMYIAKRFPFNSLYFWLFDKATAVSAPIIEYYNGRTWVQVADMIDYTQGFLQDGMIQFTPSINDKWQKLSESSHESTLGGIDLYDMYWLRITTSVSLAVTLKNISYAFTDKQGIESIDKDLDSYLSAFNDKDFLTRVILDASHELVLDLRTKGIVINEGQILNVGDFYRATAYKALEIIYFNLGNDYLEQREIVVSKYNSFLDKNNILDRNGNAMVDQNEQGIKVKRFYR